VTGDPSTAPDRPAGADWPADIRGVTESVVTTLGPNDRWNVAALGLHAGDPVTAKTFGNTRTRRNFEGRGRGVVQFVDDPVVFVDAALSTWETEDRVLEEAAAWVEVEVEQVGASDDGATTIREWELMPVEATVRRESVPTINRGFGAVVEATVAASRLDVPAFDTAVLLDRLEFFADVVERTGGEPEQEAFDRIDEYTDWRARLGPE
jgi:hypothetical protein